MVKAREPKKIMEHSMNWIGEMKVDYPARQQLRVLEWHNFKNYE